MCAQKSNESQSSKESNPFSISQDEIPPEILTEPQNNPFSFKNFLSGATAKPDFESVHDLPDINLNTPSPLDLPEIAQDLIIPDIEWSEKQSTDTSLLENLSFEKKELDDDKKTIEKQRVKIEKLEKKLKLLMDKEENENKVLELAVQQVEKNLEEATKRAVASENTVELLKLETTQLKLQIKSLTSENLLLKTANANLARNTIFTTLNGIADEINEAALAAENSLTYLGAGVSTLRLIASRLQSLEKISEII